MGDVFHSNQHTSVLHPTLDPPPCPVSLTISISISTTIVPTPAAPPPLSVKRIRPPGQEPREHSPQKFRLSALPKLCGLILSDFRSARCQQRFCLLGGGRAGWVSQENAVHLAFSSQHSVYACFWIRRRHPASRLPPSIKAFLLHQTTKAFPHSFFGHQIFL